MGPVETTAQTFLTYEVNTTVSCQLEGGVDLVQPPISSLPLSPKDIEYAIKEVEINIELLRKAVYDAANKNKDIRYWKIQHPAGFRLKKGYTMWHVDEQTVNYQL